jgi:hypothetical protein
MKISNRRDALRSLAALPAALAVACSRSPFSSNGSRAPGIRLVKSSELSELERKFGIGPDMSAPETSSQFVKVRPDVHLVEEGPRAVRAITQSGLGWILDPGMTGAIQVGSMLLVTNRCAGRVLATRPVGGQIEVILGPAELGDYIESCNISLQQPIDLDSALRHEAPDYPGAVTRMGGDGARQASWWNDEPRILPAVYHPHLAGGQFHDAQFIGDHVAPDPRFDTHPFANSQGIGVRISPRNPDLAMEGEARIALESPQLDFALKMDGRKVMTATVSLQGGAGLILGFDASNTVGVNNNVRLRYFLPVELSVPISGFKLPFAATMSQILGIQTAFASKGSVAARGEYAFRGGIEMGFSLGGGFNVGAPTSFSIRDSLVKSVSGVAMAPVGLILSHRARAIVGIGAFGFVTGPYATLTSTAAVTHAGAGNMAAPCRQATLSISMAGGVGYSIPESVANVINTVLSIFHVKGIKSEGGFQSEPRRIINTTEYYPPLNMCKA